MKFATKQAIVTLLATLAAAARPSFASKAAEEQEPRSSLRVHSEKNAKSSTISRALAREGLEDEVTAALDRFRSQVDVDSLVEQFKDADYHKAREAVCRGIGRSAPAQAVSLLAQDLDSTISLEVGTDVTVVGVTVEFGLSLIWGEDGQFACAESTGIGASIGLLGVGVSAGISISPKEGFGGWDTVGADWREPDVCLAIGYSVFVGVAATMQISPSKISQSSAISMVSGAMAGKLKDTKAHNAREGFLEVLLSLPTTGITSIGVEATLGVDALDFITFKGNSLIPDVSVTACTETLTYCEGAGCETKMMVDPWNDGSLCGLGTTCGNCDNKATYWYSKAFTACGSEPKWSDGAICAKGTTCNACQNPATYWYGKAFTACGSEPKWLNGSICALGTTCNACANGSSYWYGKAITACGLEPKWNDGTICAKGTTCNACQNGSSYWYGKAFTACGSEPKWNDGTVCLAGTSCNACKNPATWWVGSAITKCGKEPCWGRGTVCGAGTTCNSCCGSANCPWYQFGVCTCN